jgi:hypothetical protein
MLRGWLPQCQCALPVLRHPAPSLLIHHMASAPQPTKGSLPTHAGSEPRMSGARQPSRTPGACLVKPGNPDRDLARLHLREPPARVRLPPGLFLSASRPGGAVWAPNWAQACSSKSKNAIEAGSWRSGGPGLRVLCSSSTSRTHSPVLLGRHPRIRNPVPLRNDEDFQSYSPVRVSVQKCLILNSRVPTASCAGMIRNAPECAGAGHNLGTNGPGAY